MSSDDDAITLTRAELKALVRKLMQEIAAEGQPQQHLEATRLASDMIVLLRLAYTRKQYAVSKQRAAVTEMQTLFLTPTAEADLDALPGALAEKMRQKIEHVARYAHIIEHQHLHEDWPGFYQVGIGDLRAVYSLSAEEKRLSIETVRQRSALFTN